MEIPGPIVAVLCLSVFAAYDIIILITEILPGISFFMAVFAEKAGLRLRTG